MTRDTRRRLIDRLATGMCLLVAAVACFPLLSVLFEVVRRGAPVISWEFLNGLPEPPLLPGGGIRHAILGTLMVVGLGTLLGAPTGIMAGIFLSEFRTHPLARYVRIIADVMTGIPSIVAGLFGYTIIVIKYGFSAWAGAFALAFIMVPIVTRTTEEALRTVPQSLRDASLALGAPNWYTTARIVVPTGKAPLVTGLLLAVARISGETAPLLMTVLNSFYVVTDPTKPVATLPLLIYDYGKSAIPKLNEQSWGAALVLITIVLTLNVAVRIILRKRRVPGQI